MSATLHSLLSSHLSSSSLQVKRWRIPSRPTNRSFVFNPQQFFPSIRVATDFSLSLDTGLTITSYSEIVPDTIIFDDFERFPPTAATVSSSLILGICSLPDTKFMSTVDIALADSDCCSLENSDDRMSCFFNKALVNVGGDLASLCLVVFPLKSMLVLHMTHNPLFERELKHQGPGVRRHSDTYDFCLQLMSSCDCSSSWCFCYSNFCWSP